MNKKIEDSLSQTLQALKKSSVTIVAILLLISFVMTFVPESFYKTLFTGNSLLDSLTGAVIGSVALGNPINSYVIGGELLENGVGLSAVTAFILAWVTVGVVQLPAESIMLGKKFAILRNSFSFITAIMIALLIPFILQFV